MHNNYFWCFWLFWELAKILSLQILYYIVYCLRKCSELEEEEWHFELSGYRRSTGSTVMSARMQKAICIWSIKYEKFLSSKKCETTLFLKRYTYCKEATIALKKHHTSYWHCDAMEVLLVLTQCTTDLDNLQRAVILFTKFTQINLTKNS